MILSLWESKRVREWDQICTKLCFASASAFACHSSFFTWLLSCSTWLVSCSTRMRIAGRNMDARGPIEASFFTLFFRLVHRFSFFTSSLRGWTPFLLARPFRALIMLRLSLSLSLFHFSLTYSLLPGATFITNSEYPVTSSSYIISPRCFHRERYSPMMIVLMPLVLISTSGIALSFARKRSTCDG